MDDIRKVFDKVPELFDKWRPKYSKELFDFIVKETGLTHDKKCLEIGPGTGQASDFALQTGCEYTAIELGEHLADFMRNKYKDYNNFHLVNADFEKHNFANEYYDLVYSAAAIQWIDEDTAYKKCFDMLKPGGTLAMFLTRGDYKKNNVELFNDIQKVYDKYFITDAPYTRKFDYQKAKEYGFSSEECFEFYGERIFNADEYIEYISTHSDHIMLNSEYRAPFFNGIHNVIIRYGNHIKLNDVYVLYLCRK